MKKHCKQTEKSAQHNILRIYPEKQKSKKLKGMIRSPEEISCINIQRNLESFAF